MNKTIYAALISVAFMAGPALADCAGDLAKIDEAMKAATLDDASKAKATELLTQAKAASDAKDEATCTASTKEILTMLGM
jgi:hypothetical protein